MLTVAYNRIVKTADSALKAIYKYDHTLQFLEWACEDEAGHGMFGKDY